MNTEPLFPDSVTTGCTNEQNVCFSDDSNQHALRVPTSLEASHSQGSFSNSQLADFLSRPIKVFDYDWDVDTDLLATFDPWSIYLNRPDVSEKMAHFYLFRCNMKLKVVLNGTAFNYGNILMSYYPNNRPINGVLPVGASANTPISAYPIYPTGLIYESQRPHLFLNPTQAEGAEMSLPFFYKENYFRIPEHDWDGAGEITLRSLMPLRSANGSTSSVNVTVFAHCENVEMTVPTLSRPGVPSSFEKVTIAAEASEVNGLISKPASTVASIADSVGKVVPTLKPYAKATSMVASGIGQIAKLFGFSRPLSLREEELKKITWVGNFANTDRSEAIVSLDTDSKRELAISGDTVGLSTDDEMVISDQVRIPALLFQFPITPNDGVGAQLAWMRVNPAQFRYNFDGVTDNRYFQDRRIDQTPMCHASQPFTYWCGDITFRFQVMASTFHKLRLAICYDPDSGSLNLNGDGLPDFNKVYTYIMDLQSTKDFAVKIAWAQDKPYLKIPSIFAIAPEQPYFTPTTYMVSQPFKVGANEGSTQVRSVAGTDNGALAVYVLNPLVTPNDSATGNPVCNVYVASDNMDYKLPNDGVISRAGFFHHPNYPPSARAAAPVDTSKIAADNEYCDPNTNTMPEPHGELMPSSTPPKKSNVFFGSNNLSWRELCKRYVLTNVDANTASATTADSNNDVLYSAFVSYFVDQPTYPGFDPYSSQTLGPGTSWPDTTAYTHNSGGILQWISPMYAGMRGSFRKKILATSSCSTMSGTVPVPLSDKNPLIITHNRAPVAERSYDGKSEALVTNEANEYPTVMTTAHSFNHDFLGSNVANHGHNNVLESEVPFYVPFRFKDPRILHITQGFSSEDGGPTASKYTVSGTLPTSLPDGFTVKVTESLSVYTATAEDFNLYWRLSTFPIWDKAAQKL